VATAATVLQVTPEGERALVDAQLRELDDDLRYVIFAIAADCYSQALEAGRQPSIIGVIEDAMRIMVSGPDAIIAVAPPQ
jgi:hypothetical protein